MRDARDRTLTSPRGADRADGRGALGLRIVYPREAEGFVPLALGREWLALGRTDGLPHATVSRRHLGLRRSGFLLEVRDEGSHNGTWADGERLAPGGAPRIAGGGTVVRAGDLIAVLEERSDVDDEAVARAALPGDAPAMRHLRAVLGRVAQGTSHVTLLGETGVGKELAARELHRLSGRGAFVAFNCAGLAPALADSQLFGHERGAFTGATHAHEGLFRRAHGGTLFLDEVAELDLQVQAKLLRVIENGELTPVGGDRSVAVDVRVVAATQPDLEARVAAGRFRQDLFARLALATLTLPPLRERRGDIPGWVETLEGRWRERDGGEALRLGADAMEALVLARHRDNLRGLDRAIYQLRTRLGPGALVTGDAAREAVADLGRATAPLAPASAHERPAEEVTPDRPSAEKPLPEKPSKEELERVLREHGGSVRATAKYFARDRRQIYRWMEAYGLGE